MRKQSVIVSVIGAGLLLTATAYADPYTPAERAIGGVVGVCIGRCRQQQSRANHTYDYRLFSHSLSG